MSVTQNDVEMMILKNVKEHKGNQMTQRNNSQ